MRVFLRKAVALLLVAGLNPATAGDDGSGPLTPPAAPKVTPAAPGIPAEKLPIAVFAQLPFVELAQISPDGTHWAGLLGVDGNQVVAIFSLFDKTEKIARIALPDGVHANWLRWVNADNIIVCVRALQGVEGRDWYISRTIAINRISGKLTKLLWDLHGQNGSDVIWMPANNSNEILIAGQNSIYAEDDFWPAVHRVDVTTGRNYVIVRGRQNVIEWAADGDGTVRVGVGYNDFYSSSSLLYRPWGSSSTFRTVARAEGLRAESPRVPFMFLPGGDHGLVVHDDVHGMAGIYEIDLATQTEIRQVYAPPTGEVCDVLISQDGSTLLGARTTASNGGVHWFDQKLAEVQSELDDAVPNARVNIESMSSDRTRMLVQISAADMPGALYYYKVEDGVLHKLANFSDLVGLRRLAPVKLVSYQARDGLEIEGVLTLPVGRVPQGLPFIVMPHGGPWYHDTLTYDYWAQFLANRGYVVLQPNFRGSTGYGTEFLRKGHGELGKAMQDDVTDGVHWAVTQGLADARRVCIVGASYGGYAAMWGIAKDPDVYRCAISIAGVSSLRREVNDFGSELFERKYRDTWNRMAADFDAISPINAVDRIKTPLLLIHGKKDVTVGYAQSSKMYDRMQKSGKAVELVSLPLADHYYSRQADRIALLTAMETFLTKYNPAD
jgi:dipeptidyl aminopeptidase/acylaminoacyl peptidase